MNGDLRLVPLADDDGPDPVEAAIWERLRWAGHETCLWSWSADTFLIHCLSHDDRVVGAVDPDHPRAAAVGDPAAVRSSLAKVFEGLLNLERHLASYGSARTRLDLSALETQAHHLRGLIDELTA